MGQLCCLVFSSCAHIFWQGFWGSGCPPYFRDTGGVLGWQRGWSSQLGGIPGITPPGSGATLERLHRHKGHTDKGQRYSPGVATLH